MANLRWPLAAVTRRRRRGAASGGGAVVNPGVKDTFTRADTTSGLGTAETGQTWVAFADPTYANQLGITGNVAYAPNGTAFWFCDVGFAPDHYVEAVLTNPGANWCLWAGAEPSLNNGALLLVNTDGSYTVYDTVSGTSTPHGTGAAASFAAGDTVGIALNTDASALVIYKNGTGINTATGFSMAHLGHYVGIGLATASAAYRVDSFIGKALISSPTPG